MTAAVAKVPKYKMQRDVCSLCDCYVVTQQGAHELMAQTCKNCLGVVELVATGGFTGEVTDKMLSNLAPVAVERYGLEHVRFSFDDLVTEVMNLRRHGIKYWESDPDKRLPKHRRK